MSPGTGRRQTTPDGGSSPTHLTRRRLLTALGLAGGAGAVFGALELLGHEEPPRADFATPTPTDFTARGQDPGGSVLVLGAGVAGLCCAWELQQGGYDVTVVEARDRIGGRNWTVRGGDEAVDSRGTRQGATFADGQWFNPGPARIAQHHTTLEYCRRLGVPVEVFVNANADAWIEADGVVRRQRSARVDLGEYVAEILTKAVAADTLDADVTPDELERLAGHLRAANLLDVGARGWEQPPGAGGSDPSVAARDELSTLLGLGLDERLAAESDWHQAMPMFHPVGGMDAIPRALADDLVEPVRTGHEVVSLETTSTGVVAAVRTPEGSTVRLEADHGVCTLPPALLAELDTDLEPVVRRALDIPVAVEAGKIGLEYADRFWEVDDRIFGGITATDHTMRVIWYPSTGWLGRGGVLVGGYPIGPGAQRFSRLPHENREEWALEAGEAIHGPVYRTQLQSSFSVDWATTPFSGAAWMQWPRYDLYFNRLQRPAGRWWFAGDWVSRTPGWQHGAFESARQVVAQIHDRALAERADTSATED